MKKLIFTYVVLQVFMLFSCKDYNIQPAYMLNLSLIFPDGYALSGFPDEGVNVKLTNTNTGRVSTVTTNASGKLSCTLVEGSYNVTCSFTVIVDGEEYTFNGTQSDYVLSPESDLRITLTMANNSGGFVLKEIYFAGSKTPEGKTYYSDQFHEIYNNTGDILYADSLCIGVLQQSSSNPNVWLKDDGSFMDELPITFHVWMVPGDGDDHPVLPGESIVIAQDGIDHRTDPNGNPNSPVNLGNAEWESYVEISGKDLDAPGVPNLTMMYTTTATSNDWLHSVFGSAVVIFRLPEDWHTYVDNPGHFMTLPGSTSSIKYFMVNKDYVIDAVEIVRAEEDKRYKRLHNDLDAGYTYMESGSYCGMSIRRKVKMIVDGRVIYKDTNNSSEDFLHDLTPTPGVNPSTVEN